MVRSNDIITSSSQILITNIKTADTGREKWWWVNSLTFNKIQYTIDNSVREYTVLNK